MGRIVRGIWGFWGVKLGNDEGDFFFIFFLGGVSGDFLFSRALRVRRYRGQGFFFFLFFCGGGGWDVIRRFGVLEEDGFVSLAACWNFLLGEVAIQNFRRVFYPSFYGYEGFHVIQG